MCPWFDLFNTCFHDIRDYCISQQLFACGHLQILFVCEHIQVCGFSKWLCNHMVKHLWLKYLIVTPLAFNFNSFHRGKYYKDFTISSNDQIGRKINRIYTALLYNQNWDKYAVTYTIWQKILLKRPWWPKELDQSFPDSTYMCLVKQVLGGLTFISWRIHGINLYLPTLVRIDLFVPVEQGLVRQIG